MQHLDEGTIHAWLDGELPAEERTALEAHIAECERCAAAVAEARGFIAASSRILTALDSVPGGVIPAGSTASSSTGTSVSPPERRFVARRAWMAVAAVLVLSTVTVIAVRPGSETPERRVAAVLAGKDQAVNAPQAEQKPEALDKSNASPPADSHDMSGAARTTSAPSGASVPAASVAAGSSSTNAPATMQSRAQAPAAPAPKPVDQTERLKTRLESERQSTRVRPSESAPRAMASAAPPPARVSEPSASADALSMQRAESGATNEASGKREDVASTSDSTAARRMDAKAAQITIMGRVTSTNGIPISAATIAVEGAGVATTTREDGSYSLSVPAARLTKDTTALVARLIGYRSAGARVAIADTAIVHDFVLASNPTALNEVVVTGAGTPGGAASKRMRSSSASAPAALSLPDGERARIISHDSSVVSGEPVEITQYRVRGESITLIERLEPDTTRVSLEKELQSRVQAKSDTAGSAINHITWTDSTGRIRTLQGAVSTQELERFKQQLFGATP